MIFIIAGAAVGMVVLTLLSSAYLRAATSDLGAAQHIWSRIVERAQLIVADRDFPEPVAHLVFGLVKTTGCGCFVSNLLLDHFFPRLRHRIRERRAARDGLRNHIKGSLQQLSEKQQEQVNQLFVDVVIFDALTRHGRGWLFKWVAARHAKSRPTTAEIKVAPVAIKPYEAKTAALSVAASKKYAFCKAA